MLRASSEQAKHLIAHAHGSSVMARFAVGAWWALVGAVGGRGLTLVAAIIAARVLGATAFGELGAIQSSIGLFGVLAGVGLGLTTTTHIAAYRTTLPERAGTYVTLSLTIAACSGAVVSLGLGSAASMLAAQVLGAAHLVDELRIAALLVLLGAISGVQLGCLAGLERFRLIALVTVLRGMVFVGAQTWGALAFGLTGAVWGVVLAEAAGVIMQQVAVQHACRSAHIPLVYRHLRWNEARAVWQFALPALLSSLATQPALWIGNVLLVHQPNGYAALGLFVAADKWRQLVLFLPASVASIVLPMLSNLYGTRNVGEYQRMFKLNLVTNLCAVGVPMIGIILLRRVAMATYGPEYAAGHETLVLLAASAVGVVLNNVLGQVLVSQGLIWWRCAFDVVLAGLLVVFAVLFIPTYREQGMAAAHCAAYTIVAIALLPYVWWARPKCTGI